MRFTKMHGIGNDYIYVNCLKESIENPSELSKKLSDRHFGIGSDGLILIYPSKVADFEMRMYNSDGSRGEMCGNGIRCVGKYVYDKGLTTKDHLTIETLAGIKKLKLEIEEGKAKRIKVDMGAPILEGKLIPVNNFEGRVIKEPLKAGGREYEMTCVSMGNPHCIIFGSDLEKLDIETQGAAIENHEMFPNRINAEFVEVIDKNTVKVRVWERGAGETMACGTGACAVAVAGIINGLLDNEVTVKLRGGDLKISWDGDTKSSVFMTGEATTVFEGDVCI